MIPRAFLLILEIRLEYSILKSQIEDDESDRVRDRVHQIGKDVLRTDRTSPFYKPLPGLSGFAELKEHVSLKSLSDILLTYTLMNQDIGIALSQLPFYWAQVMCKE